MKLIYVLSALALTVTVGCNNQPEKAQAEVVEKETVRVVEVEAPAEQVVVKEDKGTSIKIGPDGGSVKTKSVDVEIKH